MTDHANEPTRRAVVQPGMATWRYMGEREVADRAYCMRFNVEAAPEPLLMAGDVLAYPPPYDLPAS